MRITAVCAGLGLVVGGVLVVVLRFVVGPGVLDGLGARTNGGFGGLPRRYADYLPTDPTWTLGPLRLLPVALGAGLVAGLLLGAVLRVAATRHASAVGRALGAGTLALVGLVVGVLLALELHSYGHQVDADRVYGWYSYSPLPATSPGADGIFYGGGPDPSWWPLVITGAVVGLVVGGLAAVVTLWTGRTRRA